MAATQDAQHIIHLINPTPPPSERRTSRPYEEYGARTRFASKTHQMLSTTLWPLFTAINNLFTVPHEAGGTKRCDGRKKTLKKDGQDSRSNSTSLQHKVTR